jgi:uncharacterized alkaline shock family protein YloU
MSNFKLTSNDKQKGKIVYNAGIVQNIVELAVAEVEGTVPAQGKKSGISLFLEKDGIYVDVSVVVKYGYNVPELAYRIQQTVKQSVENMTHFKVAQVDVHIKDVLFVEDLPVGKGEEPIEGEGKEN